MNDILLRGGDENGRYRHLRHRTLNFKRRFQKKGEQPMDDTDIFIVELDIWSDSAKEEKESHIELLLFFVKTLDL